MNLLEGIQLNNTADGVRWALEKSGKYSTKSMYRCDQQTSAENLEQQATNEAKIFLWQVCSNKLQTGVELKKRNWKYSHLCGILWVPRNGGTHLFYLCSCKVYLGLFQGSLGVGKSTQKSARLSLDTWVPMGCENYYHRVFLACNSSLGLWTKRATNVLLRGNSHDHLQKFCSKSMRFCRNGRCC